MTPGLDGYTFDPPSRSFSDVVADQIANYTGSSSSVSILTVTISGSGVVTSDPAGIDCGEACQAAYATGATVTLTAAPGDGYVLTGWEGGGCSGIVDCVVTITAIFKPSSSEGNAYLLWTN